MRTQFLFFLMVLLSLASCFVDEDRPPPESIEGVKPIYLPESEFYNIESQVTKPFGVLGKIVASGDYIYVGEQLKGIHVINNTDPSNPIPEYFWSIPANVDFTLKEGFLYADNSVDLLTINVSDPAEIRLVSKLEDIYNGEIGERFPPDYSGFFECVDATQGIVIGWETAELSNPKCRR